MNNYFYKLPIDLQDKIQEICRQEIIKFTKRIYPEWTSETNLKAEYKGKMINWETKTLPQNCKKRRWIIVEDDNTKGCVSKLYNEKFAHKYTVWYILVKMEKNKQ